MKVCFETFGCRLNRAEALEEEARYLTSGWKTTHDHSAADLIIVRGCSVTGHAQSDCERLVLHLRHKYPNAKVVVRGCLVDPSPEWERPRVPALPATRFAVPTRTARAYLKVQDGCSGHCTFCIVPQFRGKSVSLEFPQVIDRARRFIEAGYHEIVVTGCNLSLYASQGKRLPDLLAALADLGRGDGTGESTCRIRLGSLEPGTCALETLAVMADHPNICRFLHIPIQSASNRILLSMRRPYLMQDVNRLIEDAICRMPRIGLGCDLMAGFPDETDIDHLASKTLLQRYPFSNVHVFRYSERPRTMAATFPNEIPRNVRSARAHELARLGDTQRRKFAKLLAGQEVEVLVEDDEKEAGWTSEYVWFERQGKVSDSARHLRKTLMSAVVAHVHGDKLLG